MSFEYEQFMKTIQHKAALEDMVAELPQSYSTRFPAIAG
jgi:hypothetical protein